MVSSETGSPSLKVIMLGLGLEVMGGIASVERLIIDHCPDRTSLSHISTFEYGTKSHKIRVFVGSLLTLFVTLAFKRVDVTHLHFAQRGSTWRAIALIWICKLFGKPMVIHAHGSEFRLFWASLSPLFQRVISTTFRQAEQCIVLSESWKDFYTNTVGLESDRVVILMNPVKIPEAIPARSTADPIRFVFLGRIGERKGTFDLLEAIAQLPDDIKDRCKITIAGDGEIEKAHDLAAQLGITRCVQILGWVNADKRDELLAESHAFLLPSYNEGLPMSLLEAMGWELAAIVTPVGGIPEVLNHEENGVLVEPGNTQEIAKAIERIVTDEDFRRAIAQNGRASIEKLDISHYQQQLRMAYEAAIQLHNT
jgi:glycosyltransferase involved in cell wall biosynthesis